MADFVYICDPEKNKECRKTNCWVNGGPCEFTTKYEYATDDEQEKYKDVERAH